MFMLLVLVALAGCRGKQRTALVVEVDSNLVVPGQMDTVDIAVTANGKTQHMPHSLVGAYTLPIRTALIETTDNTGTVDIVATGSLNGNLVVHEEAVVGFVEGQAMLLKLFLAAECRVDPCAEPTKTCTTGGVCVSKARPPTGLTPFDPTKPAQHVDAAVVPTKDSGMPDVPAITDAPPAQISDGGTDMAGGGDAATDPSKPDTSTDVPYLAGDLGNTGTDGFMGTGGKTGTGGITATGGTTGTGGITSTGGAFATGGSVGTGGMVGTGGSVSGTGGVTATGGSIGTGGIVATFDPTWAQWPMPNGQVDVTAGAPNLASYTDNGNGTVTDNVTGLMWQQAVPTGTCTWEQAKAYCQTLTLAGHGDWRLPSRIELVSIVDFGRSSPAINTTYFPSTPSSNWFWTSSPMAGSLFGAWSVNACWGYSFSDVSNALLVRCVR